MPGTPLQFRALLNGMDAMDKMKVRRDLSFDWSVTSGVIVAGQGEPIVTIEAQDPQFGEPVITLVVGGLSSNCPASISFSPPPPIVCGLQLGFDIYGALDLEDEQARLDNFAIALLNEPKSLGYIIAYGGRRGRRGEAQAGAERARLYLVNERKVDAGRVVTIDGGFQEEITFQLIIVPPGAAPPTAAPTIDERDVKFTDQTPGRAPDETLRAGTRRAKSL